MSENKETKETKKDKEQKTTDNPGYIRGKIEIPDTRERRDGPGGD